jgi:hypothetical protein
MPSQHTDAPVVDHAKPQILKAFTREIREALAPAAPKPDSTVLTFWLVGVSLSLFFNPRLCRGG